MRIAFVAWTPLHLINIINVYKNFYQESKSDLYIYSEFENATTYSQRLEKLGIFDRVILVDHKKIGSTLKRKLNLITNHNQFFSNKFDYYDEIFIQGENYFTKILFSNAYKNNKNVKLNYIEDGLGTYLNNNIFLTSKNIQKFFMTMNRYSIFSKKIDTYFVYCPELLLYDVKDVKKIPKIAEKSELMSTLTAIFGLEKLSVENKSIFFDQPLLNDGYGVDETIIFTRVKKILPKSRETVVKLHPRSDLNRYGENINLLGTQLPFEVLLAENDFSSTLLISPISTISFSPSMMFEKNINSILLAKLILREYPTLADAKRETLENIALFCQKYNNLSEKKILLPSSWDELRKLVE
ncbi:MULTISPECIES: polysialyltransferase family glycosyltransferase [unclassified Enterococcus]|uniref:polysialyltransferase family glycosyltransferase n=1 Tax=unclassified Enterococcus TaxID=2608891 RepID=UPI0013ECCCFD|nr:MULTISPECIES: polysialyltransferase family glycosyltransferase [unclassified Enterococcus]